MHIEYAFNSPSPEVTAVLYIERLAKELRRLSPTALSVEGTHLIVAGGMFRWVSNWNLLISVTSAIVSAVPVGEQVKVQLDARVTQLIVFCCFMTAFFFVAQVCTGFPWEGLFLGPVLVWGWLFGMNYFLTRIRLAKLLCSVAQLVDGPSIAR